MGAVFEFGEVFGFTDFLCRLLFWVRGRVGSGKNKRFELSKKKRHIFVGNQKKCERERERERYRERERKRKRERDRMRQNEIEGKRDKVSDRERNWKK